jgi:hypothetical protein
MLDPLTALSVAGNVVQFVDFGTRVLQDAYSLYKGRESGLSADRQIQLLIEDLLKLIAKLRWPEDPNITSSSPQSGEDLQGLCDQCTTVADRMIQRLKSRRVTHRRNDLGIEVKRVWNSLGAAIKTAWNKEETATLMRQISDIRKAVEFRVIVELR